MDLFTNNQTMNMYQKLETIILALLRAKNCLGLSKIFKNHVLWGCLNEFLYLRLE